MKTVIIIAGPTAVGKTGIAIAVAQRLGTSIISADSRQCYEGMPIGTAQPDAAQLMAVPHYFIGSFPVTQPLSASDFEQYALEYLGTIFERNDVAIVCGGTGLYIKALCEGLDEMPPVDPAVAAAVNEAYRDNRLEWLQQQLEKEDPRFLQQGEKDNPARLMRALIFKRSTGKSILDFRSGLKKVRPFRIIKVGLELPREVLYERINRRAEEMIEKGLEAEVERLFPLRHLKNLQTVGYSELFAVMEGKISRAEAITQIKQHTRNYAKRQITWFRKEEGATWLRADDPEVVEKIIALRDSHSGA